MLKSCVVPGQCGPPQPFQAIEITKFLFEMPSHFYMGILFPGYTWVTDENENPRNLAAINFARRRHICRMIFAFPHPRPSAYAAGKLSPPLNLHAFSRLSASSFAAFEPYPLILVDGSRAI